MAYNVCLLNERMNVDWAIEPSSCLEPKVGVKGLEAATPTTVTKVFRDTVQTHGTRSALHLKRPVNVSIGNYL